MNLNTPLGQLNRVGKTVEKRLKYLGLKTVQDLLSYYPFRYEDFSVIKNIKDLKEGEIVTIKARIEMIANKRSRRRHANITEAVVADETEKLKIIWFGQPFLTKTLKPGDLVYLSGKVSGDFIGLQMTSPSYERVTNTPARHASLQGVAGRPQPPSEGGLITAHTARIVPMYSLTSGITQKQIRFLLSQIIDLAKDIPEWIPEDILERADVMPISEAIKAIHFPESSNELKHAERRLKFDELFVIQLRSEMVRQSIKNIVAPQIIFKEEESKKFVQSLPFSLTKAQKVSAWEILQDMARSQPMNRLLEGDVGSGKTVVSAMAMYNAVLNGYQTVLMAPTEILAFQHYESLNNLLKSLDINIALLSRSKAQASRKSKVESQKSPIKQKEILIDQIHSGEIDVIVGTHALLSDEVEFGNLGLVVVDEQQRFGVEQRKIIKEKIGGKNKSPHFLSMTATPIPRSFALALYGDLDVSIINEMPKDRKVIKTRLVEPHNRQKAYEFIHSQVNQGRQVFVVCPLISRKLKVESKKVNDNEIEILNYNYPGSAIDEKKTVMDEYEKLSGQIFPDLKIGFLHGKLKSEEKEKTMADFGRGDIDILVSTSVVEVGVDIPNASVMMIEGAEYYGLAQLHQFRGRVGRSSHQSYCFLFTGSDSPKVSERLKVFESTNDGFKVAEYDLQNRGPGEVYGTTQSGMMNLRLATLKDTNLIKLARDLASGIDFKKYPSLKERVREWERGVHLE